MCDDGFGFGCGFGFRFGFRLSKLDLRTLNVVYGDTSTSQSIRYRWKKLSTFLEYGILLCCFSDASAFVRWLALKYHFGLGSSHGSGMISLIWKVRNRKQACFAFRLHLICTLRYVIGAKEGWCRSNTVWCGPFRCAIKKLPSHLLECNGGVFGLSSSSCILISLLIVPSVCLAALDRIGTASEPVFERTCRETDERLFVARTITLLR